MSFLFQNKILRIGFIVTLCIYASLQTLVLASSQGDVDKKILKAQISQDSLKEVFLKLVPDTLIDADLSLPGDFFSVVVTKPSAQLLQIPSGSRLIGKVVEIEQSKSFNRSGKLKSQVDQVMLPDGSLVKAHALLSADAAWQDMDKPSGLKKISKAVVKKSAELGASALVGAVDSVQYFGLGAAIASYGISTAIGAGAGLAMEAFNSSHKAGPELDYNEFEALNFKLESEFELLEELPISKSELEQLLELGDLGIAMKVLNMQKEFSRQFGEFILVEMQVENLSQEDIYLGDFVLASDLHIKPVLANPLLSSQSMQLLKPKEKSLAKLAFSLGSYKKKENYKIYLLNPIDQTIVADAQVKIKNYI